MERSAWTDARLDDRFDHVDSELANLRTEMREGFAEVRGEMGGMRSELGGQIEALRITLFRGHIAMMVALVGVIAAILARGA
jgi:hypothetical protein